jgi:hypothetical protein
LSILDMRAQFDGSSLQANFTQFVCDVVKLSTPQPPTAHPARDPRDCFKDGPWRGYIAFVGTLFNLITWQRSHGNFQTHHRGVLDDPPIRYDVISMNYDLVLEWAATTLTEHFLGSQPKNAADPVRFSRDAASNAGNPRSPRLAKLHGCVSDGLIVPPTWRKALSGKMAEQWGAARDMLGKANHIRILGYSLPVSDAYVRYLLKAAASESPHLKTIDVVTLDPSGAVAARYVDFITFKQMRFASQDLGTFLWRLPLHYARERDGVPAGGRGQDGQYFDLEQAHEALIG